MTDQQSVDAAEEIRQVAHVLASEDLDDAAAEDNVSEAMWLIKEPECRAELSGSLGIDVGEFFVFAWCSDIYCRREDILRTLCLTFIRSNR